MSQTVAVDFDGVICVPYGGEPLPGAFDFLRVLKERGYTVAIHTCTKPQRVRDWLLQHRAMALVDFVTNTKPPAVLYVDDRGCRFENGPESFGEILASLDAPTWWEREGQNPVWMPEDVAPESNELRGGNAS